MSKTEGRQGWKKGESGNRAGRPRGTGRSVSRLRGIITKLEGMSEKALENIDTVVNGGHLDKQVVETSKWVISLIPSMSRAATQEEQLRENVKARKEEMELREKEIEAQKMAVNGNVIDGRSRFSSKIVPFEPDEDDEDDF